MKTEIKHRKFEQKDAKVAKATASSTPQPQDFIGKSDFSNSRRRRNHSNLCDLRELLFKLFSYFGRCQTVAAGIAILLAVPNAWAAGFFVETFEEYPIVTTNVQTIGNGWGASSNTVMVVSNAVGNQTADIAPGEGMWNTVNTSAPPNWIWTDFRLNQTNFLSPDILPSVNTGAAFMVAISTNGYLYACNPTSYVWEVCLTDAVGVAINTTVSTGSWARISAFQNFSTHKVSFFLNDHLIRKEWPFINTNLNSYTTVRFDGAADGNVLVDNVSVSNGAPAGLVSDSDNDGRPDAEEFTLFGSLSVWNPSLITAAVTNNIGGTVTPTNTGATVRWLGQTNFVLTATNAYIVDKVWTNGNLAVDYRNLAVKSVSFVWSNIVADGMVTAGFFYNGIRYVPGDYATITDAVAAAQANDRIVVSNGNFSENVTIASNLVIIGTNLTGLTSLTVQTGVTATVSGFTNFGASAVTVGTNGVLVFSNDMVNLTGLAVQNGGFVYGYNSTAVVKGVHYNGTFVFDQYGYTGIWAQPLDFFDGFEPGSYTAGQRLDHLGDHGWNANDTSAMVVANPDSVSNASEQVASLPRYAMASNWVDGTSSQATNIWTDLLFRQSVNTDLQGQLDTNGASPVMFFINTNGYLTVLTPSGWDVCSNDVWRGQVPTNNAGEWVEISWFMDFTPPAGKVSYFVNGHLLRQGLPFAKYASRYNGVKLDADDATVWFDNVNIMTNVPAGVTNWAASDSDHDGIPDAVEIAQRGTAYDTPLMAAPTVSDVGTNRATLSFSVTNNGGVAVLSEGSVWGTTVGTVDNHSASLVMTGMSPGQHTYARGWASNAIGVAYSAACEFFTEPIQATNLTYDPVAGGFTISWIADESSTGTVVLIRQDAAVDAVPVDGSNYTVTAFGGGAFVGSSNYVVFAGPGTNVTVNNLVYGVNYQVAAFAYAGHENLIQYRTNSPPTCILVWPPRGSVYKIR